LCVLYRIAPVWRWSSCAGSIHVCGVMSVSQSEKIARFRALHSAPGAFIIPNPWDAGSARMLASLGFDSLATSSAAAANTLGRRDYGVSRDEALALAKQIVDASDLPVSADLENGFGARPETVAETVRLAASIGLAGCSIEDAAGDAAPYDLTLATERVAAAMEAARSLPHPIVITARAENYLRGKLDLDDTIKRLQAFEKVGADVLFAPGLPSLASVRMACSAVTKPVNVVGSMQNGTLSVGELAAAGVKRISLAASLYRVAMAGLRDAASELKNEGTFRFVSRSVTLTEINAIMR
jgi:2-methylisocitrate lyase-like PEP mutase family enzyme